MSTRIIVAFNKFFYEFLKEIKRVSRTSDPELYDIMKSLHIMKEVPDYTAHIDRMRSEMNADVRTALTSVDDSDWFEGCAGIQLYDGATLTRIADAVHKGVVAQYTATLATLVFMQDLSPSSEVAEGLLKALALQQRGEEVDYDAFTNDELAACMSKISSKPEPEKPLDFDNLCFDKSSMIGSLAQEIAKDVNIDGMDINSPGDIFSGKNANLLGNIVKNVSSNLHERLNNGKYDPKQLMEEAMGILGNNGAMSELMKTMGQDGLMDMLKNVMPQPQTSGSSNSSASRKAATMERLKKKVEARKKTEE